MTALVFVRTTLDLIRKTYGAILGPGASAILKEAKSRAEAAHDRYANGTEPTWGYTIFHNRPLVFKPCEVPKETRVDVYCNIQWENDEVPVSQDIKMRVWSSNDNVIYREDFDSQSVLDRLSDPDNLYGGTRVVSRYHFDKADLGQRHGKEYHPKYHLQIGGVSEAYELCWHPKSFDVPRLPYHPMDLFLLCEFVAINFFPTAYNDGSIRGGEWESHTATSQKKYLASYYENCVQVIRGQHLGEFRSLLQALRDN